MPAQSLHEYYFCQDNYSKIVFSIIYDSIDAYSSEQIFQVVSVEKYIHCIIFVAKIEILIV